MTPAEARWIVAQLAGFVPDQVESLVNIGSSTVPSDIAEREPS